MELLYPPGLVYLLWHPASDRVKIGRTAHPRDRLRALRCEHGDVRLLAVEPGGPARERLLHRLFADHRLDGEWFDAGPVWEYARTLPVPVNLDGMPVWAQAELADGVPEGATRGELVRHAALAAA